MKRHKSAREHDNENKANNLEDGKTFRSSGVHTKSKICAMLLCASLAMCAFATGCSGIFGANANMNAETPASQNRSYMSKVNQAMSDLETNLQSFTDAVSRGDAISMKTQSDKAMVALGEIKNIEAPDAMKDIKSKYDAGVESLKSALVQYVSLYTGTSDVTQEALAPIQQLYDAGVNSLKEADASAASMS